MNLTFREEENRLVWKREKMEGDLEDQHENLGQGTTGKARWLQGKE